MNLFQTTVHTLRGRTRKLEADLAHWAGRANEDGDLPLHTSQMTRLNTQISKAIEVLTKGGPLVKGADVPADGDLATIATMRRGVGSVHLIWDFFRDKLAQRDIASSAAHLRVADDLAWACYEPFLEAASNAAENDLGPDQLKEPPLVFYDVDRSPFALARSKAMQPAGFDPKDWTQFRSLLRKLPVPVIGIPWSITNRLPELVLVGHETGHIVAEDLGLAAEAEQALLGVQYTDDPGHKRRDAWLSWCDEVWADVFGVFAVGRAYVDGLAAELVGDEGKVTGATIDPTGKYPSPTLRVALCERVLRTLDIDPSTEWNNAYGILVPPSEVYEKDIERVVLALCDRSWDALGGLKLEQVLPWTQTHEAAADKVKSTAKTSSPSAEAFDVRVWIAAAMKTSRAFPDLYQDDDIDSFLTAEIDDARTATMRSTREEVRSASRAMFDRAIAPGLSLEGQREERTRLLTEADREAGAALADILLELDLK